MKAKRIIVVGLLVAAALLTSGYHALRWHSLQKMAKSSLEWAEANIEPNEYSPLYGYVPDEATAVSIAVREWESRFGKDTVERNPNRKAVLVDGIWVVMCMGELRPGVSPYAHIRKETGEIIRVYSADIIARTTISFFCGET